MSSPALTTIAARARRSGSASDAFIDGVILGLRIGRADPLLEELERTYRELADKRGDRDRLDAILIELEELAADVARTLA